MSQPASVQSVHQAAETRRTIYALNKQVDQAQLKQIIEHAILHTPSAFNSQSTRLVVLTGDEHHKVWQIIEDVLRGIVNDNEKFASTEQKINSFKAGIATILFYEDQAVVKGLQQQFALYADKFPVWAEHANAMHQYAIWTALAAAGIGASLQHYNPVADDKISAEWNIDSEWTLVAQMVVGGIEQPAGEKTFEPVEKRVKFFG